MRLIHRSGIVIPRKAGAFECQPIAVQAEILKNRIKRIVVQDNGVIVEIYGQKPELIMVGGGSGLQGLKIKKPTGSTQSAVRTVFKLVGETQAPQATVITLFCDTTVTKNYLEH